MKKNYLFFFIQNTKALSLMGGTVFFLLSGSALWDVSSDLTILDIIGIIIAGMLIVVIIFFLPLLLASLFRYLLQSEPLISIILTFVIFYGYGYLLFHPSEYYYHSELHYPTQYSEIFRQTSENRNQFMYYLTFVFICLSECFIYIKKQKTKLKPKLINP